jgi:hypothetical protein
VNDQEKKPPLQRPIEGKYDLPMGSDGLITEYGLDLLRRVVDLWGEGDEEASAYIRECLTDIGNLRERNKRLRESLKTAWTRVVELRRLYAEARYPEGMSDEEKALLESYLTAEDKQAIDALPPDLIQEIMSGEWEARGERTGLNADRNRN